MLRIISNVGFSRVWQNEMAKSHTEKLMFEILLITLIPLFP
jgi:hypothetical protein